MRRLAQMREGELPGAPVQIEIVGIRRQDGRQQLLPGFVPGGEQGFDICFPGLSYLDEKVSQKVGIQLIGVATGIADHPCLSDPVVAA